MADNYARPLNTNEVIEEFLQVSLQLDYTKIPLLKKIVSKIVDGELGVSKFMSESQTINEKEMRDREYRDENIRWDLREKIINDLLNKKRLDNDDKMTLKKGGALPICGLKSEKKAFILTGLPASGKSTIATMIAEDFGGVIIDSDFVKRKLPEFKNHKYGASIVHEESSQLTFGFKIDNPRNIVSLYQSCIDQGHNVIIPRIGQNPVNIHELATALQGNGYETHLILVSLPRKEATIRAIYRYAKTNRYVPLGLIFDQYGNDPSHSYYYLRCKHKNLFKSFGAVTTIRQPIECMDYLGDSPVLKYKLNETILKLP